MNALTMLALLAGLATPPAPIEVALTFDDLPGDFNTIHHILAVLRQNDVYPVTGFVNAIRLEMHDNGWESLQAWWQQAGSLGNHTYSHVNLKTMHPEVFKADIDRNEEVLQYITQSSPAWHIFRYPFLEEGRNPQTFRAVREHLAARNYRVAEVTIDCFDWAYDAAYARCAARGDHAAQAAIARQMLQDCEAQLTWADQAGRYLSGHPIKHIALLHVRPLTSVVLGTLVHSFKARGVRFVSVDEAMTDPFYQVPTESPEGVNGQFLQQVIHSHHVRGAPPYVRHPTEWLNGICP